MGEEIRVESIPIAFYRAMDYVWKNGDDIRTQYARKEKGEFIDKPSKDINLAISITNPFNQPRYPPISYCEIGKYIAEILGVKDHLVVPYNELKEGIKKGIINTKWSYTYHQRLYALPLEDGSTLDQVDMMLEKLVKDPFTRRAVADTAVAQIDNFLKEDIPCLREIQLRCSEKNGQLYLNMDAKWRSRDLFKAWHDNVIGLTFWQARLAEELSKRMEREVKVGRYTDYSSSLHIYGQDFIEKGVENFIKTYNEEKIIQKSWNSEDAKDLLVIPQLEDLLQESYWKFPDSSKDLIKRLINDLKEEKYLA